jgi:TusA-related sulfurtransferase
MNKVVVDVRHLLCPLPVIRVQDCARSLGPGTVIEAICTDPGALVDIPTWCRINGHRVLETRRGHHEYIVLLQTAGG